MRKTKPLAVFILLLSANAAPQQPVPGPRPPAATPSKPTSAPGKAARQGPGSNQAETEPDRSQTVDPWLERARLLTNEVLDQDRPALEEKDLPALNIQLARLWWKYDPLRAQQWLDAATEAVEHVPQNEKDEDRKARLENASLLAQAAGELHRQALEKRMIDLVKTGADSSGAPGNLGAYIIRNKLGVALIKTTMTPEGRTPENLFKVGRELLQLGQGNLFSNLEMSLRAMDAAKADELTKEAISIGLQGGNTEIIFNLLGMAYPPYGSDPHFPGLPPELASAALQAAVEVATKDAQPPSRQMWGIIQELQILESKLPVAQAMVINERAKGCSPDAVLQGIPRPGEDPEQLLDRGNAGEDAAVRGHAKVSAAILAFQKNQDYVRALQILDGMSEEEKKATAEWKEEWQIISGQAVRELTSRGDTSQAEQILDQAPEGEKTQALLDYALTLDSAGNSNYALIQLAKARASMREGGSDSPLGLLRVFNAYLRLFPQQSDQVLQEVVTALNQLKPCHFEPGKGCPVELGRNLEWANIPDKAMDLDPGVVRAAVADVQNAKARASLRLGLVRAALARHEREQKQAVAATPSQ